MGSILTAAISEEGSPESLKMAERIISTDLPSMDTQHCEKRARHIISLSLSSSHPLQSKEISKQQSCQSDRTEHQANTHNLIYPLRCNVCYSITCNRSFIKCRNDCCILGYIYISQKTAIGAPLVIAQSPSWPLNYRKLISHSSSDSFPTERQHSISQKTFSANGDQRGLGPW